MSLLDINMQDKDILLHLILKHCQQFVSKEIKIIDVRMYDRCNGYSREIDWDNILNNSDKWYVYYVSGLKTDWDVIITFSNSLLGPTTPFNLRHPNAIFNPTRGGYKVSEFINETIKPSYLT